VLRKNRTHAICSSELEGNGFLISRFEVRQIDGYGNGFVFLSLFGHAALVLKPVGNALISPVVKGEKLDHV
jgi:hypothetical protein